MDPPTRDEAHRLLAVLRRAVRNEHDESEYEALWQATRGCPHRPAWLQAAHTGRDLWLFFRNYAGLTGAKYRDRDALIDAEAVPWVRHIEAGCRPQPASTDLPVPKLSR